MAMLTRRILRHHKARIKQIGQMNKSSVRNEKPQDGRRYNPELLKKGFNCDLDQYEMLKRCSDRKDMSEWNEWRLNHQDEDVQLEGANLNQCNLKGAFFCKASVRDLSGTEYRFNKTIEPHSTSSESQKEDIGDVYMNNAKLRRANLDGSLFYGADFQGADLNNASLSGSEFWRTALQRTKFGNAIVNGCTLVWRCEVDCNTNFRGVGLNNIRIDPASKQLLEYNIRCKNWKEWYKKGKWWQRILKRLFVLPFWLISDYGLRTWRIIFTFFGLAFGFALVYWLLPSSVMVNGTIGDIRGLWHALYFSVVTMTTLGFGDIAANPDSWVGQTLLMVQVILGYVLLGALITRFAVLFTAGGPAGKFADEEKGDDGK